MQGIGRIAVVSIALLAAAWFPASAAADGLLLVAVAGGGTGTVVGEPGALAPINCPPACASLSGISRVITLTARPSSGSVFAGWDIRPGSSVVSGCGTNSSCTLSVASAPDEFGPGGGLILHLAVVNVTATFVPRQDDSAFLCYSKWQLDPGVWPAPEAARLLAGGYWPPYAIRGTSSSTRLGAYSLVCNPRATATVSQREYVDSGGTLTVLETPPPLGFYPTASS